MDKLRCCLMILLMLVFNHTSAKDSDELIQEIEKIINSKKAVIGVSIIGGEGEIISINGDKRFPMQSVFKLHIALAMLSKIDNGEFALDQTVQIHKQDLALDLYSPIKEEYPSGTTLTIKQILDYMVSQSDNVACEVILRILGGPSVVENYFSINKFTDIAIKFNEEQQQADWELQFQNWTTPNASSRLLKAFFLNESRLLSTKCHSFIWSVMRATETGEYRLKGLLPAGTVVAHKTGSSGVNKHTGVTAAVNDVGIIFLPNGEQYYISVFVSNSYEDETANERIIAEIARASWDYYSNVTHRISK